MDPEKEPDQDPEVDQEAETAAAYVPLIKYYDGDIGTTLLYPLPYKAWTSSAFAAIDEMHPDGHNGLDLAISTGTPILAAEAGTVTKAEYYGGYGNCVFIDHGDGLETRYGHMSEINVQAGDTVKRGQQIGRVGSTGRSTGPHLHFEVIYNGQYADPAPYIVERCKAGSQTVTVDGIEITVEVEAGAFPVGWQLVAKRASKLEKIKAEKAINAKRQEEVNVVKSYTFDIKILDADGNEVEPAIPVKVSFSAEELACENLDTSVYHIHEETLNNKAPTSLTPTELEVVEETTETVTVETDGFSYYTVEFTYGELQYVLGGDSEIPLATILEKIGLVGEVSDVKVSNEALFTAIKKVAEGKEQWIVKSLKAFTSLEWMKVTIDGIVYEIVVTDKVGGIDNDSVVGAGTGITQSGTVADFAKGMDIPTISIDYTKIQGKPSKYKIGTRTGWINYPTSNGSTGQGGTDQFQLSAVTSGSNANQQGAYLDSIRTRAQGYGFDWNSFLAAGTGSWDYSYQIRYNDAAVDVNGNTYDVIVKYDAISLYMQTGASGTNQNLTVANFTSGPNVRATSTSDGANNRYGLKTNVTVSIVDGGSSHTDETAVSGTFIYSVSGLDQGREQEFASGTTSGYYKINSAGDYVTANETNIDNVFANRTDVLSKSSGNYNFSESVETPTGLSGDIYIPGKSDYGVFIDDNGRFVATPYSSGDSTDHSSFIYGFASLGNASGVTTTAYSSSYKGDHDTSNPNTDRARDIYFLQSGASHKSTSSSGENGKVALWNNGKVDGTGTQLYETADSRTVDIPNGKEITYKLIPDAGYVLKTVDASGGTLNNGPDNDGDGNPDYYTYTYPGTVTTNQTLSVTWKKAPTTYAECNDCKNTEACNDCFNGLNKNDLDGYEKEANGIYRGGLAYSATGNPNSNKPAEQYLAEDGQPDSFTSLLPYATIFIDPDKIKYQEDVAGSGKTSVDIPSGSPFTTFKKDNKTQIAYNGGTKAYLKDVGALNSVNFTNFNKGDKINLATTTDFMNLGPTDIIYSEHNNGQSLAGGWTTVVDGQNIVKNPTSGGYLYKIKYEDAAILPDGTRGDVILTVNQITLETATDVDAGKKINVQNATQFRLYFDDDQKGIPGDRQSFNAMGTHIDWDLHIEYKDGTVAEGVVAYGARDMDLISSQTHWGRVWNDPNENYAEGMYVVNGAVAYAVTPEYSFTPTYPHPHGAPNMDATSVSDGWAWGDTPGIVVGASTGVTANGIGVRSDGVWNARNVNGEFIRPSTGGTGTTGAGSWIKTASERDAALATTTITVGGNTYSVPKLFVSNQYIYQRADAQTYDTGFATLLDASGASMRWTGSSAHAGRFGGWDNQVDTNIFDETGFTYLTQSHGTGGGIQLEAYDISKNCESYFIEGTAVFGIDATAKVTIIPEDGHRVKGFYIDNNYVAIDEENNTISIDGGAPVALGTPNTLPIQDSQGRNLKFTVTRDTDGTYDVLFENVKRGLNVHADFETDYYFQKIWEGGAANEQAIPDELYIKAVPYITKPDSVTINNQKYEIKTQLNTTTGEIETVFTGVNDGVPIVLNEDTSSLPYTSTSKHPAKTYPQLTIGSDTYVMMGNELYKTKIENGKLVVDETTLSPIIVRFERYEDDSYIHETEFIIKKEKAIPGDDIIDKKESGGDVIWRIKYPDAGVDWDNDGSLSGADDWAALPLEKEDTTGAHTTTADHVERIYWFAMENIDKLTNMWLLDDYINEYDNGPAVMPGLVTYEKTVQGSTAPYYSRAYWYTQSTKDYYDVTDARDDMANIQLAVMTPLSDRVMNNKDNPKAYEGYGGKIINRIIETKLKINKVWIGDGELPDSVKDTLRNKLDMTIKRTYNYEQPKDIPAGHKGITLPTGAGWNTIMTTIAGGNTIEKFRRDAEPLLTNKLQAQNYHEVDADGATVGSSTLGAGDMVFYKDPDTGAELYIWYDSGNNAISYWTDAESDYIYLNENSSGMFKDLAALNDIVGCEPFNASKVKNMSQMFAITSGSGNLVALDYLRKWDTAQVEDLTEMFLNQGNLTNINGIVDWYVDNVKRKRQTTPDETSHFKDMFKGGNAEVCDGKTVPFIFYPRFYVQTDGNINVEVDTDASDDANDLLYLRDGKNRSGIAMNNNGDLYEDYTPVLLGDKWHSSTTYYSDDQGTVVNYASQDALDTALKGGATVYTKNPDNTWTWIITELLPSDSTKWEYKIYEDAMVEYKNLEGAVTFNNRKDVTKNPASGYLEYTLRNKLAMYDLTVEKNVTGNMGSRDQYFKYEVDIPSILPGHQIELDTTKMLKSPSNDNKPNDATKYTYKEITDANTIDLKTSGEGHGGQQIICTTGYVYNGTFYDNLAAAEAAAAQDGKTKDDFTFSCTVKYLYNGTKYDTQAEAEAAATGAGGTAEDVTQTAEVKMVFYLKHSEHITLKEIPYSTGYTIIEETATGYTTHSVDGHGDNKVNGVTSTGISGTTAELSETGKYYKLKDLDSAGNAQYEEASDYYADWNGSFDTLKKYKIVDGEYVEATDGTYYYLTNGLYGSIAPEDRYDSLTNKYTLDVTRAYTNNKGVAVPTEIRENWYAVVILPIAILALLLLIRHRRKMAREYE